MKNVRYQSIDVANLVDFKVERKYPLQKSNGTSIMENNVSYIFKQSLNMRQMMQLTSKKRSGPSGVGSLKQASGTTIAEDVDRDVKYYLYEMADNFINHGALRCLLNNKLLIEITSVKNAPTEDAVFDFPDERFCPLLVAAFVGRDIKSKVAAKDMLDWVKKAKGRTKSHMEDIWKSYEVSEPVYDAIHSIVTENAARLSPTYKSAWQAHATTDMKPFTPTFIIPLSRDEAVVMKPPADFKTCSFPGCIAHADHTCARCRVARYCGTEHQHQHWKAHKPDCKKLPTLDADTSILIPILDSEDEKHVYVSNMSPDVVYETETGQGVKGRFIVKVQTSIFQNAAGAPEILRDGPVLIYDAKKALSFQVNAVPEQAVQHARLVDYIAKSGIVTHVGIRCKAYFYAKKEKDQLRVYIGDPCEAPEW